MIRRATKNVTSSAATMRRQPQRDDFGAQRAMLWRAASKGTKNEKLPDRLAADVQ